MPECVNGWAIGPPGGQVEENQVDMLGTEAMLGSEATRTHGESLGLFEPSTEIIRKGKASKSTEFGKMVELQDCARKQLAVSYP